MSGLMIPAGAVPVRDGAVLIGDCCCRPVIEELLIESLGPQDDDLRVDVLRIDGGGAWETLSDTRLNVSAYNGEIVSPGGAQGFNNAWATTGFRALRFGPTVGLREGDRIRVWTVDVGGVCQLSMYRVTVRAGGMVRQWIAGRSATITPPSWPSGTIGPSAELLKTSAQRPWQAPGSPAIYVPNGECVL